MNSKKSNEPFIEARAALDLLFRQARGLPELEFSPRSYLAAPTPRAAAYEPVEGGDPDAILKYVWLVREHVANLNSLLATHREFLLPISRNCFSWPMLISKQKKFGDDPDEIIEASQVGTETIADDSKAKFNPKGKFGRIAMDVLARIEHRRIEPVVSHPPIIIGTHSDFSWAHSARTLPIFPRYRPAPAWSTENTDCKKWRQVINQVLDEDLRDANQAAYYRSLITANSHKQRWKAVFKNKVLGEFDSLWGLHRKPVEKNVPSSHANLGSL
jgi:hypothetical protein